MKYWYERFKKIRLEKKMSQGKMARALGIDTSSISRYERSEGDVALTENFMLRLGKFFTEEEIAYIETGSMHQSKVQDSATLYNKQGTDESIAVPYHADVYAAAGAGSNNTDGSKNSPISFSKHFLNNFLGIYNLKGLSIINAAGDSMVPTIKSGELMFVVPVNNEGFKDGGIYVIMCGSDLYVKRVWRDPLSKEYTLASDNDKVADLKLSIDESSECHFVGRVVGHMDRV